MSSALKWELPSVAGAGKAQAEYYGVEGFCSAESQGPLRGSPHPKPHVEGLFLIRVSGRQVLGLPQSGLMVFAGICNTPLTGFSVPLLLTPLSGHQVSTNSLGNFCHELNPLQLAVSEASDVFRMFAAHGHQPDVSVEIRVYISL